MMGNRTAIGLDVGRDAVKLVRAERRRGGAVVFTHAAMLRLPGEGTDTTPVVRRWLDSLNLPADPCVVGMPGRSIILKSLELEAADPRTPAQAAGLEIQKLRKLTSEEIVHDVKEIAPSRSGTRRMLMFVVRPDVLDTTLAQPTALGLDVVEVTPTAVALFNLAKRFLPVESGAPVVLLDVGHKTTELVAGDHRGIRFVRSFDIGAGRFAEALAADGRLTLAQAHERFQKDPGIFDNSPPALAETIKAWHGEIGLSLDIYRDRFPDAGDAPCRILLAGGGALLKGLSAGLAKRFPFIPQEFPVFELPGEMTDPLVYALAAGLALTGVGKDVSRVSLAPKAMKERVVKRRDRLTLAAAVGFLVVAVIAMAVDMHLAKVHEQQCREDSERQAGTQHQLQTRLVRLQQENKLLLDTLRPAYRALESRVALLDVIRSVSDARKGMDWFVSIATLPPGPPAGVEPAVAGSKTNALAALPGFLVRGYTPDAGFYSVRAMIDRLRLIPRIVNADLLDESALNLTDPLAAHWATLNAIPFALTIRTSSPKPLALPSAETVMSPPPLTQEGLIVAIREQEALTRAILSAWEVMVKRFSTFKNRDDLFNLSPQDDVAFIDFRVALEETRRKLVARAQALGIALPADLGLGEAAVKDKEVRSLLLKLGAIHKWVEVALACKVSAITNLEFQEPVLQSGGGQTLMEQYPLRVTFKGRFPAVMSLLAELGDERHFMVVRQATLTRPDKNNPDMLEVTLEVAALDFPEPPDATTFATLAKQP